MKPVLVLFASILNKCVNLPRWGLKQLPLKMQSLNLYRVNLPRWGLKRKIAKLLNRQRLCVNLPRWGLKLPRLPLQVAQRQV